MNNHEKSSKTNGIWAYTVPTDLMTGDFIKYTVAAGFQTKFSLLVPNMSPGFPYAVWPDLSTKDSEVAHIMVAGDGDHSVHILDSTDPTTFAYDNVVVKDEGGTVGALAFGDLDGDGWLEVYVPNYDQSYIEVFKTSKASAQLISFLQ